MHLDSKENYDVMDTKSVPRLLLTISKVSVSPSIYSDKNTHAARNSGNACEEVMKNTFKFEFGDHGSPLLSSLEIATRESYF